MCVSDDLQGHAEASRLHAEDGAPAPAALFSPVSLHQPTRCPALDPRLSRVCPTCGRAPPPGSSQGVGGLAIFLEPYDPQHMPIEFGFRAFKQFLRNQSELIDHMPMEEQIRFAIRAVCAGSGRNAFRSCGYDL